MQQLRLAGKPAFVQRLLDAGAQQDEAQACWELFSSAEEVGCMCMCGGCMPWRCCMRTADSWQPDKSRAMRCMHVGCQRAAHAAG